MSIARTGDIFLACYGPVFCTLQLRLKNLTLAQERSGIGVPVLSAGTLGPQVLWRLLCRNVTTMYSSSLSN